MDILMKYKDYPETGLTEFDDNGFKVLFVFPIIFYIKYRAFWQIVCLVCGETFYVDNVL